MGAGLRRHPKPMLNELLLQPLSAKRGQRRIGKTVTDIAHHGMAGGGGELAVAYDAQRRFTGQNAAQQMPARRRFHAKTQLDRYRPIVQPIGAIHYLALRRTVFRVGLQHLLDRKSVV